MMHDQEELKYINRKSYSDSRERYSLKEREKQLQETPSGFLHSLSFRLLIFFLLASFLPAFIVLMLMMRSYSSALAGTLDISVIQILEAGIRNQIFVITAALLAVVSLGSYLLSQSIVRPLMHIMKAVRQMSEGDLTARVRTRRKDEIGMLARFFNITAEHFAETRERNLGIARLKSQFVTVAAHQLRTPLSAVKWTLHLMLEGDVGPLSSQQQDYLNRAFDTNEHIIGLVDNLLDASRIEEGKFGFTFARVRITDVIQAATAEISGRAKKAEVSLVVDIAGMENTIIIADGERIRAALINLLDNAVRYSRKGGVITSSLKVENKIVRITVTDTGIGIPEDEKNRIFTKFYRASNALQYQTEGSGLGLYIVQNIVERHGGSVDIDSQEGKGTTVSFTLPIKRMTIRSGLRGKTVT